MKHLLLFFLVLLGCDSHTGPKPANNSDNNTNIPEFYEMMKNIHYINLPGKKNAPLIDENGNVYVLFHNCQMQKLDSSGRLLATYDMNRTDDKPCACTPAFGRDGTLYLAIGNVLQSDEWSITLDSSCENGHVAVDANDNVYVLGASMLYAVDRQGKKLWTYDGFTSGPSIGRDGTIYAGGNGGLYAFAPDGTLLWRTLTAAFDIVSSPAIGEDGTIYVIHHPSTLAAVAPNGDVMWSLRFGNEVEYAPLPEPVIDAEGNVYVLSYENILHSVSRNGTLNWQLRLDERYFGKSMLQPPPTAPIIGDNGIIYAASMENLYAISPDGRNLAYFPGNFHDGGLSLGENGVLYAAGETGVYAIESKSSGLADSAWPKVRRERGNSGNTVFRTFFTPDFEKNLGNSPVGISASASDEIFVALQDGTIRLLDQNGDIRQTWNFPETISAAPMAGRDGRVYAAAGNRLAALSPDGSIAWQHTFADIIHGVPVMTFGKVLYVLTGDGVHALNADGTERWHAPLDEEAVGNILLDRYENLHVTDASGNVYSLNSAGERRWKFVSGQSIGTSLVLDDAGNLYFGSGGRIEALGPSGSLLWEYEADAPITTLVADNDKILAGTRNGKIHAVSMGALLWTHQVPGSIFSLLLLSAESSFIYLTVDGEIGLHDQQRQKTVWTHHVASEISAHPILLDNGLLLFGTSDGSLHALRTCMNGPKRAPWPMELQNKMRSTHYLELQRNQHKYVWRARVCDEIVSYPVSDGTTLYIPCANAVAAYQPDGIEKWRFPFPGNHLKSSPAIHPDGTLFLGDATGTARAISPQGTELWQRDLGLDASYSSPGIDEFGNIHFNIQMPYISDVHIFNVQGEELQTVSHVGCEELSYSSPALRDGRMYIANSEACIFQSDYANAAPSHASIGRGENWCALTPFSMGSALYAGSITHGLFSVSYSFSENWRFETQGQVMATPVVDSDGTVYAGTDWGYLHALDETGQEKWSYFIGSSILRSSTLAENGMIYTAISMDPAFTGELEFRPMLFALTAEGKLRWKFKPLDAQAEDCHTPLLLPDGTLYLACRDGYLYAIRTDSMGMKNAHWPTAGRDLRNTRNYH